MPRLFLEVFPSVSVTDFHKVLRLQQVIVSRHSIAFQYNLVHEQTTLQFVSYWLLSKNIRLILFVFAQFLHDECWTVKVKITTRQNTD